VSDLQMLAVPGRQLKMKNNNAAKKPSDLIRAPGWATRAFMILPLILLLLSTLPVLPAQGTAGEYPPNCLIESYNYPGYLLNPESFLIELSPSSSAWDKLSSAFEIVPGLAGNDSDYVSFDSIVFPGHFLRHQDMRLELAFEEQGQLFKEEASFKIKPGLADPQAFSFESYNYPGYYLRHRNFHLYLEQDSESELFKKDATFWLRENEEIGNILQGSSELEAGPAISEPSNEPPTEISNGLANESSSKPSDNAPQSTRISDQAHQIESNDAELIFQVGDSDNLGFGWPQGFDVFSGLSTPVHSYPWKPDDSDPAGTDRIMVGTSYDGHPPAGRDGYVSTASRPDSLPQAIVMQYDPGETRVKSAVLQMFVDDFQAPVWKSNFQVEINGRRAPFLEEVLNSLVQTGPIGKLITVRIPDEFLGDVAGGVLNIYVDDPATGAGDGYAVDFIRLLINPKTMTNTGTVYGKVSDAETAAAIQDATVSASGVIKSSTDANGEYVLEGVPAGLVAVTVSKSGYVSKTKTVDLTTDGDAELDFQCKMM